MFRREEIWQFGAIAALAGAIAALLPVAPFPIVWWTYWRAGVAVALLGLVWYGYRFIRKDERIASTALLAAQLAVFSIGMTIFNYLGFGFHERFIDAELAAADAAVGFDWMRFVMLVQSFPGADTLLTAAYDSTLLQIVLVVLILGFRGYRRDLDRFGLMFVIGASLTTIFWVAFPSYGAYTYRILQGLPVPGGLSIGPDYAHVLLDLAGGRYEALRYDDMVGLIAFPSFHTVLALITVCGTCRLRVAGPLFAVVNVVVLLSIPGDGGHYLVDLFGGAVVAAIAVTVAWWLLPAHDRRRSVGAPLTAG